MMKVELLSTLKGEFELETEVNKFIKNKDVINVSYSIVDCGYSYKYSCCVLYRE